MKLLIKRMWTRLFWVFPVKKDKIFFSSYEGKQYSCNPKYIYEELCEQTGKRYSCVWEYNAEKLPIRLQLDHVTTVQHNSIRYFYHILTAGTIITNSGVTASIALRKSQTCVNTWHGGGAYKKVGAVISESVNGTGRKELLLMADHTDYFLSSSHVFTEIMVPSTLVEQDRFLEIGMPRNDMFFRPELAEKVGKRTKETLGLSMDRKTVLYAPTYRGTAGADLGNLEQFPVQAVLEALKMRFGGVWTCLYRAHYHTTMGGDSHGQVMDVSSYPDMQELLCMVDVLITDYSSSIWDFSLTGKPCFLYVPDLESYRAERDFYSEIESWPGELAETETALCEQIARFEAEQYQIKLANHHQSLGICETGKAAKLLLNQLEIN